MAAATSSDTALPDTAQHCSAAGHQPRQPLALGRRQQLLLCYAAPGDQVPTFTGTGYGTRP